MKKETASPAPASANDPKSLLHSSEFGDKLRSTEEHAHTACYLSRALWHALASPDLDMNDERDASALRELASMVALHASAAVVTDR